MRAIGTWIWVLLILIACCGPVFLVVFGIVFIALCIIGLIKPGWFGCD